MRQKNTTQSGLSLDSVVKNLQSRKGIFKILEDILNYFLSKGSNSQQNTIKRTAARTEKRK